MNGLQATSSWQSYFGHPKGSVLGVVNAAQSIGSVISLPLVGYLSDRIGRRYTLLAGCLTVIIASAIQAGSVNYAMFVVSRLIVGVGGMLVTQPAPMLISELAMPQHRGKYTSLFWTFVSNSIGTRLAFTAIVLIISAVLWRCHPCSMVDLWNTKELEQFRLGVARTIHPPSRLSNHPGYVLLGSARVSQMACRAREDITSSEDSCDPSHSRR